MLKLIRHLLAAVRDRGAGHERLHAARGFISTSSRQRDTIFYRNFALPPLL